MIVFGWTLRVFLALARSVGILVMSPSLFHHNVLVDLSVSMMMH